MPKELYFYIAQAGPALKTCSKLCMFIQASEVLQVHKDRQTN